MASRNRAERRDKIRQANAVAQQGSEAAAQAGAQRTGHAGGMPTRQQILDFVSGAQSRVGKREIARAFGVRGDDRVALKALLREMEAGGELGRGHGRQLHPAERLPNVAPLQIARIDDQGDLVAEPMRWEGEGPAPAVVLLPTGRPGPRGKGGRRPPRDLDRLSVGDRVLCRIDHDPEDGYRGKVIELIGRGPSRIVAVFRNGPNGPQVSGMDRKNRRDYPVSGELPDGLADGDVVVADAAPRPVRGRPAVSIAERIGAMHDPKSYSLVAIARHEIPTEFPAAALQEAEKSRTPPLGQREDLRALPLVTIDPEDARDHDDAVWALPVDAAGNDLKADADPADGHGWHLVAAIADVAQFVRPGSALDREARTRGNSVYFPDRVVPMLPERLSADLCSLVPGKARACLAAHLWIDRSGRLQRHRITRALMRSAASLTYAQAQEAEDGGGDDALRALHATALRHLFDAYRALRLAREDRGALEIELPERQVVIGPDGHLQAVQPRERFDAHRMIEEFMIQANVAAARSLAAQGPIGVYRAHEEPAAQKIEGLREALQGLGLPLAKGQAIRPKVLNRVLEQAKGHPSERLINELVLRAQTQAYYAVENPGHFGLALPQYSHFTSPIRRYADLMAHRLLIGGLGLGRGGYPKVDTDAMAQACAHVSMTERRAMLAEREAMDRFATAFIARQVGREVGGRISGVTRAGLFVQLDESGADGLVPMSGIGREFFVLDDVRHRVTGSDTGIVHSLGDPVKVEIRAVDQVTNSVELRLVENLGGGGGPAAAPSRGKAGRGSAGGPARKPPGKRPGKRGGKQKRR